MKVIYGIGKVKKVFKKAILAVGVFDGLHLGHQALIKKAVNKARSIKGKVIVLTFAPHPIQVLRPEIPLPLIISLPYRLRLLGNLGVETCVVIRFTKRFSRLTPERFIKEYLVKHIQPQEIFVGDDFRFGRNRSGTLVNFQPAGRAYGFNVKIIPSVSLPASLRDRGGQKKIGSTLIRQLIIEGKLNKAKRLLGRNVSIMGTVVKGDARGKTLGFPTANIYPGNEVIPPLGVYAVKVDVGKRIFNGMANIGRRVSFKAPNSRVNIEVHIFNLRKNLYGQEIIIEFIKKIREEEIFSSKGKLILQLKKDEIKTKSILESRKEL